MKKLIFAIIAVTFIFNTAEAQDGKKALKNATKAIGSYFLDPANNKPKLQVALDAIKIATEGSETSGQFKTWETKGRIYNEIAGQMAAIKTTGIAIEDIPEVEDPAFQAFEAYAKAIELAVKKYEKKKAFDGIRASQQNLYNFGIFAYEDKKFESAVKNFKGVLSAHDLLSASGKESTLDEKEAYDSQLYVTGLSAVNAGQNDIALEMFMKMYEEGTDKPAVYESLYKIKSEEDLDAAYKYLEEGRTKFPDDVALLFSEINHFLKLNRLDELISKIKLAIEKEPNNLSLYSTLGNVFDNLYQKANEEGNEAEADKNFGEALKYYKTALEKDPGYFDAIYSIGALYYNKAAFYTVEENKILADCTKPSCLKEADVIRDKANEKFAEALPFFKKAESINPNDINTLIALKEMLVRGGEFDASKEFKARLEKVQNGEKNETSFYKN